MAKKTSGLTRKYDWGDGKGAIHTISKEQAAENQRAKHTPIPPPPGSYDPNIDAQEGAAGRQLDYLTSDTETGKLRALNALDTGTFLAKRTNDRTLADLLQARQRGEQDYNTNLQTLQRNYDNLAVGQAAAQRKAGAVDGSGAAIQAAQKRATNQAIDKAPIDTAWSRFQADNARDTGRANEDYQSQIGQLATTYKQTTGDLGTALDRAQNENTYFGQDSAAARQFQASQAGYPVITQAPNTVKAKTPPVTVLTAGPGSGTTKKKKTKKGTVVTYGASVGGP